MIVINESNDASIKEVFKCNARASTFKKFHNHTMFINETDDNIAQAVQISVLNNATSDLNK